MEYYGKCPKIGGLENSTLGKLDLQKLSGYWSNLYNAKEFSDTKCNTLKLHLLDEPNSVQVYQGFTVGGGFGSEGMEHDVRLDWFKVDFNHPEDSTIGSPGIMHGTPWNNYLTT